eukprot:TRINITY_DN2484_c0_g1_i1.p1 TRINITY_DN2484_c0_g1~~TRINITY_DN2484_c0_g1_i1.p1  ORF type:complete len:442 (+),score=81.74 TRINITY_DN2484_c0_g1_i1:52-1377(+)
MEQQDLEVEDDFVGVNNTSTDVDTQQNRLLLLRSVKEGHIDVLKQLIQQGVDVNSVDPETSRTPLTLAIEKKNPEAVEVLIKSPSIKLNKADKIGDTPFYLACHLASKKNEEINKIVSLLLDTKEVDLNIQNKDGSNALMLVVGANDKETTSLLLNNGVDVNTANLKGVTALEIACQNDNEDIVKELVFHGATIDPALFTKLNLSDTLTSYLKGISSPPTVSYVSLQRYRPSARKNQLAITTIGKREKNHVNWIERDLRVLRHKGCRVLISAMSDSELREMELDSLSEACNREGIENIKFPIQKWIPRYPVEEVVKFTELISEKMKEHKSVFLHTDHGRGRAGLLAACFMISIGFSVEDATTIINSIDSKMLENPSYGMYLNNFNNHVEERREEKLISQIPFDSTTTSSDDKSNTSLRVSSEGSETVDYASAYGGVSTPFV